MGRRPLRPGGETFSPARLGRDDADHLLNSLIRSVRDPDDPHGRDPEFTRARPVHTDGLWFEGTFVPSGALLPFSITPHLTNAESNALVRFSNFSTRGSWDRKADVRGLACRLRISHEDPPLDLVAMTLARFPVRRAEDFHAIPTSLRGWPFFILTRRTTLTAAVTGLWHRKRAAHDKGLNRRRYFGVHTFWLERGDVARAVRYHWRPVDPVDNGTVGFDVALEDAVNDPDGVRFELVADVLDVGAPYRLLHDPSRRWPSIVREWPFLRDRNRWGRTERFVAGTLTLAKRAEAIEESLLDDGIVFNPVPTVAGFTASDDEILHARSSAYVASHVRRAAT